MSSSHRRAWLSVLLWAVLVCFAGSRSARAEDTVQAVGTVDEVDEEAHALYVAGKLAFEQGRFQNALEHFERAYELSKRPRLLYNIGAAADRLRKDDVALSAFAKYLEALPTAENRPAVEARIVVLRTNLDRLAQSQAVTTVQEPARRQDAPARPSRVLPIVALSLSAATALAGGGVLYLGMARRDKVENADEDTRYSEVEHAADTAPALMITGSVMLGIGVVGAALSTWWMLGRTDKSETAVSLSPFGAAIRGRF